MKSILLSLALLSSCPILAESGSVTIVTTTTQCHTMSPHDDEHHTVIINENLKIHDEQTRSGIQSPSDEDEEDNFFEENDDLPPAEAPRPISPLEAYMRECGVNMLLQYVAAKVWLEHQWKAFIKSV